jgi:DNA-binding FrmR family transcriptional regulator
MEPFVLAFIAIGLLVVLVFVIYLVDRVNAIEKETRQFARSLNDSRELPSVGPFAGLSSKKLWDAMTGRVPEGMDPSVLVEVRERYETVLHKHIESIFQEAVKDGQRGLTGEPKNTKLITTLRGPVESWLPSAQVNTLYKCGVDSTQLPADQLDAVRAALDEVGQTLYSKALLNLTQPLSVSLLPRPAAEVPVLVPPAAP